MFFSEAYSKITTDDYMNPKFDIYVLQSLQGQGLGIHLFICFLNKCKLELSLISEGITFQILGARKETLFIP